MRLLILGGTVFLSAEIARQAVSAGDEVWCLTRGTTGAVPAGVHWVQGDRDAGPPTPTWPANGTPWSTCRAAPRTPAVP